ncbi:Fungal transcriptional regulatory protein [Penicillium brevicompactum]|uniref:uncharacterized protein n=1 Tax=Penicillium brevicompactum TaxID=5074 RepID=UPI00254236E9|nr:uncharacterized protein N7506_001701 [Penicillium brevicompactum]KAJ5348448.1 hypothetical protein N7506_001701 [Penicillium brevicompactum]
MASRSTGKRLPISCQACRTRKIRCSRDGRPCQTCVRRGLGAEDCIYLGQPRLSAEQSSPGDSAMQSELLARIRNLEALLQRQMSSQAGTPTGGAVSPLGGTSAAGSFSESDIGPGLEWDNFSFMMENVGSLHTSPSGHVRYVPLASQWESLVAKSPAAECLRNNDSDIVDDDDDLQIPLAKNGTISREELMTTLPPGSCCGILKDVFFQVFSTVFHILHDLTFEAEYQQFCHDPGSVSLSWLALLFAILSIAVTALDDDHPLLSDLGRERTVSRNIKVLSSRYRSAALRCLAADGVMSRHSINSLQALVLIMYARAHRGLPIFTLLGFTNHVAISMGCHLDPERFSLGPIEREERRRVWTGLMMLYTIQNTTLGSLDQQNLTQDVRMPADIDDVDLLTSPNMTRSAPSPAASRPTQMTYLLLNFRLNKISSKICESLFSYSRTSRYGISTLEAEMISICGMVDARYTPDANESLPIHHQANHHILYSQIHQMFLLLYRPSLCRYLQGDITPDTSASRAKCIASAKASISIFQTLLESSCFKPYKWYTSGLGSFHTFHAAVTLAVILLIPESQSEYKEIKEILDRALEMFASVSVRSVFCSKAVPILRQMIDVAAAKYNPNNPTHSQIHLQAQAQAQVQAHAQLQQTQANMQNQLLNTAHTPLSSISTMSSMSALSPVGMHDSFVLSHPHSQSGSPVPTTGSSTSEPPMHSGFGQMHPQNWIGPTSVPWDSLGPAIGGYIYDSGP